jgi:hypothetical protein
MIFCNPGMPYLVTNEVDIGTVIRKLDGGNLVFCTLSSKCMQLISAKYRNSSTVLMILASTNSLIIRSFFS